MGSCSSSKESNEEDGCAGVLTVLNSEQPQSNRNRYNNASSTNKVRKALKAKTIKFRLTRSTGSTAMEMFSICDDFDDARKLAQQENRAFDCYPNLTDTSGSRLDSTIAAPSPTSSELEMEKYVIRQARGMMPRTSSPIFEPGGLTSDSFADSFPSSISYAKWAKYLQCTPSHMPRNRP